MDDRPRGMEGVVSRLEWRGVRVLVTGHTGFKGGWLSLWLEALGAEVHGIALAPSTTPALFDAVGLDRLVRGVECDVRDQRKFSAALEAAAPAVVFHLAAQPLVRESYASPVETYATNVMGTVHLLEAVRRAPSVRAVVVVTTDKCYENREWLWGYREDEALGGHDPYSSSKACTELVTAAYARSFFAVSGAPAIATARAGNVVGGGDWAADRLVPDFVRAANERRAMVIRNPLAVRPWQHVLDPLSGYIQLAERLLDDPAVARGAWNFGPSDEDARQVGWVADQIAEHWGDAARWTLDEREQPHEARLLKLDCSKARTLLGWTPRLPLREALAWTVNWYRGYYAGTDALALCRAQIHDYESLMR